MLRRLVSPFLATALLVGAGQAAAKHTAAAPSAPAAPGTYRVAKGDNLTKIATRFGTSVADLVRINGIRNLHRIRVGATLHVPAAAPAAGTTSPADAARLPERLRQVPERLALMKAFDDAAKSHKVPADLLKAVTWMESGWQNDKISSTKAVGIGQLMPDTVAFVNQRLLKGAHLDPKKPIDNINISARYLNWLLAQTKGDVATAVAGYYQGLASVRRQGPLAETTAYVNAVVALRSRF